MLLFSRYGVSVFKMKRVLWVGAGGSQAYECPKCHWTVHLKMVQMVNIMCILPTTVFKNIHIVKNVKAVPKTINKKKKQKSPKWPIVNWLYKLCYTLILDCYMRR